MHGREKQEVERYFLRLKILLRNISPYIYIYICAVHKVQGYAKEKIND